MSEAAVVTAVAVQAPASAEQIRALAGEILARPEYEGALGTQLPSPIAELMRLFFELLDWMSGLYSTSPVTYWLFVFGLFVVLCLLITHIVWSVSRAMRDSAVPPGRPTSQASVDLVAAAQELAAQGRFLEAAHQLLLACLRSIARHGIIELHPEDTNREVRARLDGASLPGPLRDELLALLGSTERAWFRDRGQDPELYRRWQSTYADLQDLTSRLGAGASAKPPGAVP